MLEEEFWVGLDLGFRRSHLCIIDGRGIPRHEQVCDTNLHALESALSGFPRERIRMIAIEAAGEMHIARKLRDARFPVGIFESRKASKFLALRRSKTDASDARGLADLARLGRNTISEVFLKSPECQRLRSMIVMRKRLVHIRVAIEGALRGELRLHGLELKSTRVLGGIREQVKAQAATLEGAEHVDLASELDPLVNMCEALRSYLRDIDKRVETTARAHPICRQLMEVPGVGPICAVSFYTAIEDPHRFRRAADVAAYLGLVPRRYQSGDLSRTMGITKTGSKLTRTHLVTAAMVFGTRAPDCDLKSWYLGLRERIGSNRARVALARKLAIILLTMWKGGGHFEPAKTH